MGNHWPRRCHGMLPLFVKFLWKFLTLVEDKSVNVVLENLSNKMNKCSRTGIIKADLSE